MKPKTLISGLCILLAICLAIYFYAEWQKQEFDATLPVPPEPPAEEQAGGHWHGDEWHADDAHDNDTGGELIPSVDWQPSTGRPHEAGKPEGLEELDAEDPVAKAWAKLDEIADNPFGWGGNADPRTAGLVQQLMPPPMELAPEGSAEDNSEDLIMLLEELAALRDPRSIEVLVAYECESPIGGLPIEEALVAMGPPTAPYLIPYLDEALEAKRNTMGVFTAALVLGQIGAQHREELDGIIEHIVLPKLERALVEIPLGYAATVTLKEAIARLEK